MRGIYMKENSKLVHLEKKRLLDRWKDSHAVLCFLPVILTILFPLGGIFYLSGRFCPYAMTFCYVHLLYLVVLVFIFYCFFSGTVKLSGRRGKHTRNEKLLIVAETTVPLIFIGLLVAFIFLGFTDKEFRGPRFKLFTYGIRDRVKSEVNIEATRAWLQLLGDEDYNDSDIKYKRLTKDKWPESLRGLKHAAAFLSTDENGNIKVRLGWGSGMLGHWGVEIGMKDMKIPPSDFGMYGEYRLPLEPGVYVWLSE
jgi:hypothetical protein